MGDVAEKSGRAARAARTTARRHRAGHRDQPARHQVDQPVPRGGSAGDPPGGQEGLDRGMEIFQNLYSLPL